MQSSSCKVNLPAPQEPVLKIVLNPELALGQYLIACVTILTEQTQCKILTQRRRTIYPPSTEHNQSIPNGVAFLQFLRSYHPNVSELI